MASTNKTTTLDLSQFVGTDKPDWLTDYNEDMEKIDAWATVTESDIGSARADASSAKTTAGAASTAANQATTTAENALSAINNTNANIANWRGNTTFDCDSFWDPSKKLSIKFNKTLGLLNLSAYLFSSSKINNNQVICTLPAECRPDVTISIRNGAYVAATDGNSSFCTLGITPSGTLSITNINDQNVNGTNLYLNVTLSCAGWGNNWPSLNQI